MKGLYIFGWITLAVGAVLLLLFLYFFSAWVIPKEGSPLSAPDRVQALTSILALFVGSATSIGGAVATLQLASLGLDISKRQELRDNTAFIDGKVSGAIKLFSNLLVATGNVYSSGIMVDARIPVLEREGLIEKLNDKAPENLSPEMVQLAAKLQQLIEAINEILKDDFAHYCFRRQAAKYKGKLKHISDSLIELGIEPGAATVSIRNLSDVAAFLELASRRLDDGGLGDLIHARLYTNSADTELFNLSYNNKNVRTFFFTGNLIFCRTEIKSPSGKMFIASYGTAILHDLVKIIPNGKAISRHVSKRYSSLLHQINEYQIDFDPHDVAPSGLLSAINDAEEIGDLYMLISDSPGES
jgi:hypothetical protein